MGLLDSLAGQVLGGGDAKSNLLNSVMGLLGQQQGGIEGLVKQFAANGLGDVINSWVSTGKNLPISPSQISQVLGSNTVSQLASSAGLSSDQVTSHLSELLPQVIDKLTPNGSIPKGDLLTQGAELLKGFLK